MIQDWSEAIVLAQLPDEPELAEELSALASRLSSTPAGKGKHLVLDFGQVTYLNSSHIAGLLRLRKRVSESGKRLVICSMSDELMSVLLLTGLDKVFVSAPDTMTALARIQLESEDQGG